MVIYIYYFYGILNISVSYSPVKYVLMPLYIHTVTSWLKENKACTWWLFLAVQPVSIGYQPYCHVLSFGN